MEKKKKASIRITKTNTGLNTDYHFDSYRLSIPVNTNIFTTDFTELIIAIRLEPGF